MESTDFGAEQLAAAFAHIASVLSTAADTEELLQRVVQLAVATIDSCDFAGVMTRPNGRPLTAAASAPIVRTLDLLQLEAREGPCLDVIEHASSRYAVDLLGDERWPSFAQAAVETGVRSVLAFHLGVEGIAAALNLYAQLPDAFSPSDRAHGAIFATHASVALAQQHQHAAVVNRADTLQQALTTRELIGQAQGILMEREGISGPEAFDILRRASQHLNVKLRDVAQRLVDTGESPNPTDGSSP
jgi:hypothetical protein